LENSLCCQKFLIKPFRLDARFDINAFGWIQIMPVKVRLILIQEDIRIGDVPQNIIGKIKGDARIGTQFLGIRRAFVGYTTLP